MTDVQLDPLETEKRLTTSEQKIDTIMTNHLPHLQAGIDEVKETVSGIRSTLNWILVVFVGALITLVVNLAYHTIITPTTTVSANTSTIIK